MSLRSGRRSAGAVLLGALLVGACSPSGTASPGGSDAATPGPTTTAGPSGGTTDPTAVTLTYDIGPRPGPVQPFRGEMSQHVHIAFGQVSMYFELRNTGEDPVTFINTLYDYEPLQLYTPVVRLEWAEGGNAVYTRAGRFFPSPSIVPAGATAAYLMGAQPVSGTGTPADLVAHIKYCPTRGMDDVPGIPAGRRRPSLGAGRRGPGHDRGRPGRRTDGGAQPLPDGRRRLLRCGGNVRGIGRLGGPR